MEVLLLPQVSATECSVLPPSPWMQVWTVKPSAGTSGVRHRKYPGGGYVVAEAGTAIAALTTAASTVSPDTTNVRNVLTGPSLRF